MSSTQQQARAELAVLVESQCRQDDEENRVSEARFTDCATKVQRMLNSRQYRNLVIRLLGGDDSPLMRVWDKEPHFRFNLLSNTLMPIPTVRVPVDQGDAFIRLAIDSAPALAYRRTPLSMESLYSDVHVGQRKLLINEILFMIQHAEKSRTVVYIGAAGGQHIVALCEMYPEHKFLLYDPAPFSKFLLDYMRKHPLRVSVYNELFPPSDPTGRAARDLAAVTASGGSFLLISDIRRRDPTSDAPTNADVNSDMDLQIAICREMQPVAAHLKCRLPYFNPEAVPPEPDVQVKIPKGDIYFQPWCGHKSTETRLIMEAPYSVEDEMSISARWYEGALFYHNVNTRYTRHQVPAMDTTNPFVGSAYDTCFDCCFERYTLWRYLVTTATGSVTPYSNFAAVFELIKRAVGRDDDRMLKSL